MGIYTVRYAHLEALPKYRIGDLIKENMLIGTMGNSGQSEANHLHIDVIEGHVSGLYHLSEIGYGSKYKYTPNIEQLLYFLEKPYMFKVPQVITTYFYDPEYRITYKKNHPAFDIVPEDRHTTKDHFNIYWNRSKIGHIMDKGYNPESYGNWISIGYEA